MKSLEKWGGSITENTFVAQAFEDAGYTVRETYPIGTESDGTYKFRITIGV